MKKGLFLLSLLFLLTGCGEETKEDVIQEVPKQATVHCELSSRDVINGYETTADLRTKIRPLLLCQTKQLLPQNPDCILNTAGAVS